jgi:hypothetical protein
MDNLIVPIIRRRVNRLNVRSNIDIYDPSFHDVFIEEFDKRE